MLFLSLKMTCFSTRDGGGDIGMVAGTVHNGMTVDGIIIPVIPPGLRSYRLTGEITTEAADGVAVPGTLRISIIKILTGIGAAATGLMIMAVDLLIPGDVREVDPMAAMMVVPMVRMVVRVVARAVARKVARKVVQGNKIF
jgi:hypothetical protein